MTLELFSAAGALVGGLVAFLIDERLLAALFAALLVWVAVSMARRRDAPRAPAVASETREGPADDTVIEPPPAVSAGAGLVPDAAPALAPSFAAAISGPGYLVHSVPAGMAGSVVAGLNSALLGVGGGIVKVPVM